MAEPARKLAITKLASIGCELSVDEVYRSALEGAGEG
jgi:hypothetical protein